MLWVECLKILETFYIWFDLQDLEIQERVYSADKPLPDRLQHKFEYSIGRLVKQAARWDLNKMNSVKPHVSGHPLEIAPGGDRLIEVGHWK